jgi:hypothetical protein
MIEFSPRESKLFNLNFGRATINSGFDEWTKILEESKTLDLDYLRLKVVNPDSDFMAKLALIPVQAYLTGIIRLYKKRISQSAGDYYNQDIIFKKVSPSERAQFKELLKAVYTDLPMGYFQYPEYEKAFPLPLQLENISSYFSDYFSGDDETKEAYIGYMNGQPVTCFAIDIKDPKVTVCLFAGVIQDYRSKNVFNDAIKCLMNLTYERKIRQIITGARLENVSSQYGFSKQIAICYGHEWVYMLHLKK